MKRKDFTLIELLVSATCQIGVLPLYCLKKIHKNCTQERPVPMRVPRGPFGIPLPLMPGPKTLCELRAGT